MTDLPMVRAVKAHKVYHSGPVQGHALRGVDLEIARGEMVAIMGPSGCGKTTLLNCFSGLDDLTSGDVLVEGVSPASMDDGAKSRYRSRRMGFVFQSYNLLPVLTAVENVELPLLVSRSPARAARHKALEILEALELKGWEGHKPAQIMALLVRLNRDESQTLVLVTHDSVVSGRAHRIVRMRNGRIVDDARAGWVNVPREVGPGGRRQRARGRGGGFPAAGPFLHGLRRGTAADGRSASSSSSRASSSGPRSSPRASSSGT